MNTALAPAWLPSQLVPFFFLSYPVAPPAQPDSFPDANYYSTGVLDGCIIVTAIAVMAVLRDATRLFVCEPFARWYLARTLRNTKRRALALWLDILLRNRMRVFYFLVAAMFSTFYSRFIRTTGFLSAVRFQLRNFTDLYFFRGQKT